MAAYASRRLASGAPLAAAAVLDGRRLYKRRSDLHAVIAVDSARSARLVEPIRAQAASRDAQWQADPDGRGRRDVETAIEVGARVLDGVEPVDAELAALACGLTDVAVRDTLYALAVGAEAAAAEALWALLARVLPAPWRVEALVLLAFSAYARGDGPLAGISLEAALGSDPDHRMAGMLDTALLAGNIDGLDKYVKQLTIRRIPDGSHWVIHERTNDIAAMIMAFALGKTVPDVK
jgi:hypothetical protein